MLVEKYNILHYRSICWEKFKQANLISETICEKRTNEANIQGYIKQLVVKQ